MARASVCAKTAEPMEMPLTSEAFSRLTYDYNKAMMATNGTLILFLCD